MDLKSLLTTVPVIPVLTIQRLSDAVPLARALVAGGLNVLEVTLRTDIALQAVEQISQQVEGAVVGVGTVIRGDDLHSSARAGATFAVSPGLNQELVEAARDSEIPLLPGVMTPSEAMQARQQGFRLLKLFPASVAGGIPFLRALGGPLPDLEFCPTGGIGAETFRDYLALPNVLCVGGSWVAPSRVIAAGGWQTITRLAEEATV